MVYAVIDTNVLVSALLSERDDTATVQVVKRMVEGDIVPLYSSEIIKEYIEVLHREKFGFSSGTVFSMLEIITVSGIQVEPESTNVELPDIFDLPFYEVVMEKRDENAYLVTGNIKHFPKEPFIVTARQMLDILNEST